jgi:hypothetical protein
MIKQEAFLSSSPSKGASLHRGRRRRRSGLPGEFTPAAGSGSRAKAKSHISEAGPPVSSFPRLLELFAFYDGHVPGFELTAENFDVHRLAAEGLIFRTRNPLDFGCYRMGHTLEKFAALRGRGRSNLNSQCEYHFNINQREKHEDKS